MSQRPVSRIGLINLVVLFVAATVCAALVFCQTGMQLSFGRRVQEVVSQAPSDAYVIEVWGEWREGRETELRALPEVRAAARESWPQNGCGGETIPAHGSQPEVVHPPYYYVPVDPEYFAIRHLSAQYGRLLRPDDTERVAVIGAGISEAYRLGTGMLLTNEYINEPLRIVGILAPVTGDDSLEPAQPDMPGSRSWGSVNLAVFVPYSVKPTYRPWCAHFAGLTPPYSLDDYWVSLRPDAGAAGVAALKTITQRWSSESGSRVTFAPATSSLLHKVVTESLAGSFVIVNVLVCLVAIIAFGALFLARVVGRAGEIGIHRTLGMSGTQVIGQQLAQAGAISLTGTLAGWGLFLLIGPRLGLDPWALSRGWQIPLVAIISAATGPLAVLSPARLASRISPASSLRDELGWGDHRRRLDLRQATVLLAFALAVGATNLSATLGSATVRQANAYMLSAGANDIEITTLGSASPADLYERARARVESDLQIGLVSVARNCSLSADGRAWQSAHFVGVLSDASAILGLEAREGELPTLQQGEVIIGSTVASDLGLDPDQAVGQAIHLPGSHTARVAAVLKPRGDKALDRLADRNKSVFMPNADLAEVADIANSTSTVIVRCPTAERADETFAALQGIGDGVTPQRPYGDLNGLRQLKQRFSVLVNVSALAVSLVVALAVAAIMWNRVWENRRNYAIHMAIGAASAEVAESVFREIVTLALSAVGLGLAGGTLMYWIIASRTGLPTVPSLAGTAIGVGAGLLLAGGIGAIVYRRVMRTPVVVFLRGQE